MLPGRIVADRHAPVIEAVDAAVAGAGEPGGASVTFQLWPFQLRLTA